MATLLILLVLWVQLLVRATLTKRLYSDVKSAIACYVEVFGKEMLEDTPSVEVFIAEAGVAV